MKRLLTAALCACLLAAPLSAHAWQVKVSNPMEQTISVRLYYGLPIVGGFLYARLEKNESHTFDLGANCPRGLVGYAVGGGRHVPTMGTDMHGTWYGSSETVNAFAPVSCANFNIKICDMPKGSKEHYSFCIDR